MIYGERLLYRQREESIIRLQEVLHFLFQQGCKKVIMKSISTLIIIACCFTSCSKWLDVKPQSEVSQDVLFSTQEGFQEALNGIYSRCSQSDSYGRDITCGFLDVLAQNYTIPTLDNYKYRQTSL